MRASAYPKPSLVSKLELFVKIANMFQPFIIFAKSSALDVWLGSEYSSVYHEFPKLKQ